MPPRLRRYMNMWATSGAKNAEMRADQQQIREHLLDLRARELATADKLDELTHTNRELQQSLLLGQDTAATLRDRIDRVEGRSAMQLGHLETELSESRLQTSMLATSQADLRASQAREARELREEKERARERKLALARERQHAKLIEAFEVEVSDKRRENEALRAQLGAAQAQSMSHPYDAGSLHSSVLS